MDYELILKKLVEVTLDLWKNNHNSKESIFKGAFDVVTETDLAFEKRILEVIHSITPDVPILSEETLSQTEQIGTFYTVDPVDGTWERPYSY